MSTKKYFDADRFDAGDDSALAYPADVHLDEINGSSVSDRRLYRARPLIGSEFFWCRAHQEVGIKGEGCGVECDEYEPRNGKNGRCRHSSHCYEADRKEILVIRNPNVQPELPPVHADQ